MTKPKHAIPYGETEPTELDMVLTVMKSAARLERRVIRFQRAVAELNAKGDLQKLAGADLAKARRRVTAAHETVRMAEKAVAQLIDGSVAADIQRIQKGPKT